MNRHVPHRAALLGLALVAIFALALGIATGAQAAYPGANGTLAFTSTQDGGARHIFTGTSAITDLTGASSAAVETQPEFSPDGRALVFTGSGQGLPNSEIFVMSATGAGRTQLTKTPQGNGDPAWSPDGTQIAFVSERAAGVAQIFVMRTDGTAVRQVTHDATGKSELAWSPAGDRIVFVGTPAGGGDRDIWSIHPDGSGLTDLTNDPAAYDVDPAFSPDGARIVYSGPLHPGRESVGGDLWVMSADGTNQQPLHHESNGYSDGGFPAWSPDGSAIAFAANNGTGYFHIWSVPAGGGENTELVANKLAGGNPVDQDVDWQPLPGAVAPKAKVGKAKVDRRHARVRITFAATGPATAYRCTLQGGGHTRRSACHSPVAYKHLKRGRYTFSVTPSAPGESYKASAKRRFSVR
jgi:Tol biopolymer transport system component